MAAGVFLPLAYLAWHIFGWPTPIRISYETTRLTSPLTADGFVDYLRAYRERMPTGVGDYRNDPWRALFENERDSARPPNDPGWDRPHPLGQKHGTIHLNLFTSSELMTTYLLPNHICYVRRGEV